MSLPLLKRFLAIYLLTQSKPPKAALP